VYRHPEARVAEMIEALIVALWRGHMRFLRTDKERLGVAECAVGRCC
jgi:hypothetical protein